jgi:hypothetical protein
VAIKELEAVQQLASVVEREIHLRIAIESERRGGLQLEHGKVS